MGESFIGYMNLNSQNLGCDFQHIKMDVPLKLWEAITTDGGQPPLLTRFFHNKPYFYLVSFLECYLAILDPNFLITILPWWLLPLLIFSLVIIFRVKKELLLPLILFPLLFIFNQLPLSLFWKIRFFQIYLYLIIFLGIVGFFFTRRQKRDRV